MGYRTYIAEMPKREYNKIKSMNQEELIQHYKIDVAADDDIDDEGYWYKGVYQYGKDLYEFGKYTDFNPPKKSLKPFFKNKELMERYAENDFYVVTPEFLEYIIEMYTNRVKNYYNEMMIPFLGTRDELFDREKPSEFLNSIKIEYSYPKNKYEFDFTKITQEEQNALFDIIEHVRSFRTEWTLLTPYNLKNGDAVSTSWKYEYAIFELVKIYKTFDWKRKVMLFIGW
jgi:hypothetical protein